MKLFTRDELDRLLATGKDINLSIFLTTGSEDRDIEKGRIQLKNLLKESNEQLLGAGIKKPQLSSFTKDVESLLEDTKLWNYLDKGIAVFATEEDFYFYTLPIDFQPISVVKDRFYIKPLFPAFQSNGEFYILAVSQNDLRLLRCNRDNVTEIELKDVPTSLAEALKYDDPEKQLQFNTRTPNNVGGKRTAIFHGQGVGMEDYKVNILRYFQEVNGGLTKYITNDSTPVLLAGVEYLFPIYKEANKQFNLLDEGIPGNPEEVSNKELQQQGWKLVEPYFKEEERNVKEKYKELIGTGKASNDLADIVASAYNKRVEALFIKKGQQVRGEFHKTTNELRLCKEKECQSEDILDFTAFHTFINGGKVYVMEALDMPSESIIAAVYRY